MQTDMELEIHNLERLAYCAVLQAFKAQSDVLTWEKAGLITELRKELRVSDDEHRELLTEVNSDDLIHRIREWRDMGWCQNVAINVPQHVNNQVASPAVSVSGRKQKSSLSGNPFGTPSPLLCPESVAASIQPLSSTVKQGPASGIGDQRLDAGRPVKATSEWVNIKEVPREDIRWVDDNDPIISQLGNAGVPKPGRGRASSANQFVNEIHPSGNGDVQHLDEIQIFHTGTLIKKVEKVLNASHPDELEINKAKKLLEDHEQTLIQVIARLARYR